MANEKRIINIFMEGGIIQDIQQIPSDVEIHVYDYDIEGVDSDRIEKDALGDDCTITIMGGGQ